ncbi:helix-turn-helix domain-containing protein [Actinomadura fibrosa]|uniref:Helix-turn-helix domain-containing protein n=1 Tax=Actinomadura fibrosa TaxID=111802 RepID=A0ABW2XG83_9ACTN|nr:helix-turn-helix transcriptional regulator [Actinomadura fibrosa]
MALPGNETRRIGENVRAARLYRGMSLEVAAGLVGRTKGWLSRIENGHLRLERRTDISALAEALSVSATDLLGEPTPIVRPENRAYADVVRLREVLLDSSLDDPPDIPARPVNVLADLKQGPILRQRRESDHAALASSLPPVIAELHVHAAQGDERTRIAALRLLVELCAAATSLLRNTGQVDLAWVAADRADRAAHLLDDPVMIGAATFSQAHARRSSSMSRALRESARIADGLQDQLGDDRFAHQVYGMLRLTAALACQLRSEPGAASDQLDEAARVADRVGEHADAWQWFGPANVGAWRTLLAVEASEPEGAVQAADATDPAPLPRGRKAALHLEKGRALAMLDRNLQAVSELRRAEKLDAQLIHHDPMVRDLVADLYDHSSHRDLRGLAWRMNLA